MKIKKKADVSYFLTYFSYFSDSLLDKYYFAFPWEHNGTITIMKYYGGGYTIHRKNDVMWDIREIEMSEKQLEEFIWANRKYVNQTLRGSDYASSLN